MVQLNGDPNRDRPRDDEMDRLIRQLGAVVDRVLNGEDTTRVPAYGFMVLAFEFYSADAQVRYISNTDVAASIKVLEMHLERLREIERGGPIDGSHWEPKP